MSEGFSGPFGLAMLPLAIAGIALSGLPAFVVLLGVALLFGSLGLALGSFELRLLSALPLRLVGLLEHDLLQAVALYALVGALLQRIGLAPAWLTSARWALRRSGAGSALASLGLAGLTAPMNGSVGASLGLLLRTMRPALGEAGVGAARATALTAAASTLGVVVPPSLVLVLLGDAMMRAHTEALQRSGAVAARVINNQDLLAALLLPGALVLLLFAAIALRAARSQPGNAVEPQRPSRRQAVEALLFAVGALGLLSLVALGLAYAVEAAAAAGAALLAYALLSGRLRGQWQATLDDAMRLAGMIFALLLAANTFTLVLRGFGSDAWLAQQLLGLQLGPYPALLLAMGLLLVCAFVMDAFELIFVLIPLIMPPLLQRAPDAAWVAAVAVLVLQLGYLLPPLGYAFLMARGGQEQPPGRRALALALLPYLGALALVLGLVLIFPALTHPRDEPVASTVEATSSETDIEAQMRRMSDPQDERTLISARPAAAPAASAVP